MSLGEDVTHTKAQKQRKAPVAAQPHQYLEFVSVNQKKSWVADSIQGQTKTYFTSSVLISIFQYRPGGS